MQKIKIGHRANFRAKNECFRQISFPVRAILRSINFRYADFNNVSADACILVMACVDCARACSMKTLSSLLNDFSDSGIEFQIETPILVTDFFNFFCS